MKLRKSEGEEILFIVEADNTLRLFNVRSEFEQALYKGASRGVQRYGWGRFIEPKIFAYVEVDHSGGGAA